MSFGSITITAPFQETEDTVRARMNQNIAPDWSVDEGVAVQVFREIGVTEITKVWDALNQLFLQMFPATATGDFLDAHAASYGLTRSPGTQATGLVRFTAAAGTLILPAAVVAVPTSDPSPTATPTLFSTTNVVNVTVPAAGYIDIAIVAQNPGADGNVAAGAVTYLETDLGTPVSITNPAPTVGGSDPDDDPTLRAKIEVQANLPVGSGTRSDYVAWGLQTPGVGIVDVTALWDTSGASGVGTGNGNGTVAMSLRDANSAPVPWTLVQETQQNVDPSRQLIAVMEQGEQWVLDAARSTAAGAAVNWTTARCQAGETSLELTATGAGVVAGQLSQAQDLSRFRPGDEIELWLWAANWADVNLAASHLIFFCSADNLSYFSVPLSTVATSGSAAPTSGSGWWLYQVEFTQLVAAVGSSGIPTDWAAINAVDIAIDVTAANEVDTDYFRAVSNMGAAGYGLAPVGAAVTVYTPMFQTVPVTAAVELEAGYSLTGSAGTANATTLITAAITAYLASLPVGAPVLVAGIADAIFNTPGVSNVEVTVPSADVPISLHRYPVLPAAGPALSLI